MDKSTISMAIFNGYVSLPEGKSPDVCWWNPKSSSHLSPFFSDFHAPRAPRPPSLRARCGAPCGSAAAEANRSWRREPEHQNGEEDLDLGFHRSSWGVSIKSNQINQSIKYTMLYYQSVEYYNKSSKTKIAPNGLAWILTCSRMHFDAFTSLRPFSSRNQLWQLHTMRLWCNPKANGFEKW